MVVVVHEGEPVHPALLVEVHQHALLQLVLAVVDRDGVVVPVQAVDQGLDGGLLQVAKDGGRLPRLLGDHHRADQAEGVNHHLTYNIDRFLINN